MDLDSKCRVVVYMPSLVNMHGGLAYKCDYYAVRFHSSHSISLVPFSNRVLRRVFHHHEYTFQVYIIIQFDTLPSHPLVARSKPTALHKYSLYHITQDVFHRILPLLTPRQAILQRRARSSRRTTACSGS
jgi:hypothetical protein